MKPSPEHSMPAKLFLVLSLATITAADPAASEPQIHYAPAENLEKIDVALIQRARRGIDLAAYTLTDVAVIEALAAGARRGAIIRILLYEGQIYDRPGSRPTLALGTLRETPGVEIRVKPESQPPMHLKAYQVDGKWLRTGSANFSASGLKQQDNDLVILDSPEAIHSFQETFEALWRAQRDR